MVFDGLRARISAKRPGLSDTSYTDIHMDMESLTFQDMARRGMDTALDSDTPSVASDSDIPPDGGPFINTDLCNSI